MKTFNLEAAKRGDAVGKKLVKALRKNGMVPAVLYGGEENVNLQIKEENLRKLIYTPEVYIIELNIEGDVRKAILKDLQFHPVTDNVLHIDLLEVKEDCPIVMQVPISLVGHSIGVRAGGKLFKQKRTLKVKALYNNIPENLVIDITKLRLGKTIQVKALSFEGLELMDAPESVVCAVRSSRASRSAQAAGAQIGIEEDDDDSEDGSEE